MDDSNHRVTVLEDDGGSLAFSIGRLLPCDDEVEWRVRFACADATCELRAGELNEPGAAEGGYGNLTAFFDKVAAKSISTADVTTWSSAGGNMQLTARLAGRVAQTQIDFSLDGNSWKMASSLVVEPATLDRFAQELRFLVRYARG